MEDVAWELWLDALLYGNAYFHLRVGRLRPTDIRITRSGYEYRFNPNDANQFVCLSPDEIKHFVMDEQDHFRERPWGAMWPATRK